MGKKLVSDSGGGIGVYWWIGSCAGSCWSELSASRGGMAFAKMKKWAAAAKDGCGFVCQVDPMSTSKCVRPGEMCQAR
eukprot:1118108-Amphidinium_carterae.1